jgi:hypothetical protein
MDLGMLRSLLLLALLTFDASAQPVRVNLREVPLKSAIHTIYALTLKLPIVISPPVVASDKKVTVDVTLALDSFREFADSFVASQGISFANKGGALMFDFASSSITTQKPFASGSSDKPIQLDDEPIETPSLREQLRFAPDCWLSTFEPPRYSVQCLDGEFFRSEELQALKPRININLRQVPISGVVYRNRTPALFYARQSKDSRGPVTLVHASVASPSDAQ